MVVVDEETMPDGVHQKADVVRQATSARRSLAAALGIGMTLVLGLAAIVLAGREAPTDDAFESVDLPDPLVALPVVPRDDLLTLLGIPPRADQVVADLAVGREVLPRLVVGLGLESEAGFHPADHGLEVRRLDGGSLLVLVPAEGRDRGWGRHALRVGSRASVHVEVPHPVTDRASAQLGVELFEASSARHLTVAGASRRSIEGRGDAAHDDLVPFDAVHRALLPRVSLVVQVHGWATANHPDLDADVVLSPGIGRLDGLDLLARSLEAVGLRVCVPTSFDDCDRLAGRTNLQGASAAEAGVGFLHLEVADTVRTDDDLRAALVGTIAAWIRSNA